jgi:uncharacterized protein (DUF1786 family)
MTGSGKVLAIDVGEGTQDILLYDPSKNIENCTCLILPSPIAVFAERVRRAQSHLFIDGDTVGGGAFAWAVREHVKKGFDVIMTEEAAYSVRDNLDHVRGLGIEIGEPPADFAGERVTVCEVDLLLLRHFLSSFNEPFDLEAVAVAVQDHGKAPEGTSDREFRFDRLESFVETRRPLEVLAFEEEEIPSFYTRMKSVARRVRSEFSGHILVMDTSHCAILGCQEEGDKPVLIVNVGNNHTIAALVSTGKIDGLLEHHTELLSPPKLESLLRRFVRGETTRQEIFDDGGHGAIVVRPHPLEELDIVVTGPNRDMMRRTGLAVEFAAPGGNMMLTGPIGLVKAFQKRRGMSTTDAHVR